MRTLILGIDAFDPGFFEELYEQGHVPNLGKSVKSGGYARFQVPMPPQSEVSWTSIATGLNPGAHGIFDFVHRDPKSSSLYVSLLPTSQRMGGTQFVRPSSALTIFDQAAKLGYRATSLWWPATFPARLDSPVRSLPGLGTPDIQGRLGIGALYTSNPDSPQKIGKTPVLIFNKHGQSRYSQTIFGPIRKVRSTSQETSLGFELELIDEDSAKLKIDDRVIRLTKGVWTPIITVKFRIGRFINVHAITRLILTQTDPYIQVYVLPLQLHPLKSLWPYGTPKSFVKNMWHTYGPFLTLGWPQDTTGLEDGCISDEQFLDLCESIFDTRAKILIHEIDKFHEGLLACVLDSLDRVQHMFWQDRPDIVENWYRKIDSFVGRVEDRLNLGNGDHNHARLIVVSDHGFTDFNYKIHLNKWLIENGFLVSHRDSSSGQFMNIDWAHTQAFAIGLNSIYLNLENREENGIVSTSKKETILDSISEKLLKWQGPNQVQMVRQVWRNEDIFTGPLAAHGPDLVIGYSPGYRASQETGLGDWANITVQPNHDHWNADHCVDSESVPGVIFTTHETGNLRSPSYRDIPYLAIGSAPDPGSSNPPPTLSVEENDIIEERLRSLGYF
jgi:predicted AlkP superfamily phosphohydrolase/phosphomutase